jgi:hypothetical protein
VRYAKIEDNRVVNVAIWADDPGAPWVASEYAGIGDDYDGQSFTRPEPTPPAEPVPETITPAQLRIWLLLNRGLSESDIEAAITSAILDAAEREVVLIKFRRGLVVDRADPATQGIGALLGLSGEALDQAFREAAQL